MNKKEIIAISRKVREELPEIKTHITKIKTLTYIISKSSKGEKTCRNLLLLEKLLEEMRKNIIKIEMERFNKIKTKRRKR